MANIKTNESHLAVVGTKANNRLENAKLGKYVDTGLKFKPSVRKVGENKVPLE
jgi:hypothetical protein